MLMDQNGAGRMGAANQTVTKKEIIDRLTTRTRLKRNEVKLVIQEFLEEIVNELGAGRRIEFREFGVFEVRERAARTAQNPKTLQPVPVPAKRAVKFKPGRRMRELLDHGADGTLDRVAEIKLTEHAKQIPGKAALTTRDGLKH